MCVPVCVACVGMTVAHTWTWQLWHGMAWLSPFHSTEYGYSNNTSNGCSQQDTSNEASNGSTRTSTEAVTGYKIIYITYVGRIVRSRISSYSNAFAEWAIRIETCQTCSCMHISIQNFYIYYDTITYTCMYTMPIRGRQI